jgi:hypothetical protein
MRGEQHTPTTLRAAKEAFVSDWNGTSIGEVWILSTIAVVSNMIDIPDSDNKLDILVRQHRVF